MKILLAEDEKDLNEAIRRVLEFNKYDVDAVFDGEAALDYAESGDYAVIVLDVMMPKLDGFSVVRQLRKRGDDTAVLILTAKSEIDDKVLGLDSGADDYLTKPFVVKELLARIRALSRRKGDVSEVYFVGNTQLDFNTFELVAPNGKVRLTNKEYKLAEYLMRNRNVILSTEKIMENVWDVDSDAEINVVWVFISALRKKLKQIGSDCVVSAVRGVGYKLEVVK